MIARPCDGQPNRMCPSDCAEDCDFNNATLDRVMNYPLRRVQVDEFPPPAELEEALPWDWIDRLGFWWACVLTGAALGFGWGFASLLKLF